MRIAVTSEILRSDTLSFRQFNKDWIFLNQDMTSVTEVDKNRSHVIDHIEIVGSSRNMILRDLLTFVAKLAEVSGKPGQALIVQHSDRAVLSSDSPTKYYIILQVSIAYIPEYECENVRHDMSWIPREVMIDPSFWQTVRDEAMIEEILIT